MARPGSIPFWGPEFLPFTALHLPAALRSRPLTPPASPCDRLLSLSVPGLPLPLPLAPQLGVSSSTSAPFLLLPELDPSRVTLILRREPHPQASGRETSLLRPAPTPVSIRPAGGARAAVSGWRGRDSDPQPTSDYTTLAVNSENFQFLLIEGFFLPTSPSHRETEPLTPPAPRRHRTPPTPESPQPASQKGRAGELESQF